MSLSSWWLGAHDDCMLFLVPSFVLQAVSYRVIKQVTSGPVTIHFLRAAESPVTPKASPSASTTEFDCSRTWSIIIIIGDNCRLDLCTITFQFRTPEPSEVASVKSYCLCRRQEYIVHNLHCFFANKNGISSVSDWQYRLKFALSNNWINKRIANTRYQNWN